MCAALRQLTMRLSRALVAAALLASLYMSTAQVPAPYTINACASSPCQNNGSCVNGGNAYTCTCVAGYTGENCQNDFDDCASAPCQNGGSCVDDVNAYTCTCVAGYTGENCQNDFDDCASAPCQNGGSCVDDGNAYTCTCVSGYTGTDCTATPPPGQVLTSSTSSLSGGGKAGIAIGSIVVVGGLVYCLVRVSRRRSVPKLPTNIENIKLLSF